MIKLMGHQSSSMMNEPKGDFGGNPNPNPKSKIQITFLYRTLCIILFNLGKITL
jgi:hypothetical protein